MDLDIRGDRTAEHRSSRGEVISQDPDQLIQHEDPDQPMNIGEHGNEAPS